MKQELKESLDPGYERKKLIRYLLYFKGSIVRKALSPKEFEVIIKRLQGKGLTPTEQVYLSRSIKKKLEAARILTALRVLDAIEEKKEMPPELLSYLGRLELPMAPTRRPEEEKVERLVSKLLASKRVCVLTGAGISRASGIPVYRGKGGRWEEIDPERSLTEQALKKDPEPVKNYLKGLRAEIESRSPNPAHYALAKMERLFDSLTIITQNIDGYHEEAGNIRIFRLHGSIRRNRRKFGAEIPAVTLFGEGIDTDQYKWALNAVQDADVLLIIGTSGYFDYIRDLVKNSHGFRAEINPEKTSITPLCDITIRGRAERILPKLYSELLKNRLLKEFEKMKVPGQIREVYLFGSAAKGSKMPNDIDLAIVTKGSREASKGLRQKFDRQLISKLVPIFGLPLNPQFIPEKRFYGEFTDMRREVLDNGVLLYKRASRA